MGNCLCKDSPDDHEPYTSNNHATSANTILPNSNVDLISSSDEDSTGFKFPTSVMIDKLVLETLGVIGLLVDK